MRNRTTYHEILESEDDQRDRYDTEHRGHYSVEDQVQIIFHSEFIAINPLDYGYEGCTIVNGLISHLCPACNLFSTPYLELS